MANKENNINLKLKKKYNMGKFKNFVTSFHKLSKSNYLVSVINAKVTYKKNHIILQNFKNTQVLFNLQCCALTAKIFIITIPV